MRRIDDQWCVACQSKLTARDVGCISSSINWKPATVVKLKCVCGGLLYIEQSIVQLFHPCRVCDRHRQKLSCPDCIAIFKSMTCECNHNGECSCDRRGRLLSYCKMTGRSVGSVGIGRLRLRINKVIKWTCWILGIGACAWYCCHIFISKLSLY